MKKTYTPDDPLQLSEVRQILSEAFSGKTIKALNRIQRGSTNLVYTALFDDTACAIKIAHRPDRVRQETLYKEARILKKFENLKFAINIPKILWEGHTAGGLPAIIETYLADSRVEDIIEHHLDINEAAKTLGAFIGQLHQINEDKIDEFELGHPTFPNFAAFVEHCLKEWKPLCEQAKHIEQTQIGQAYKIIASSLPLFNETRWPYVHADISFENLHGKVENNKLILTGLCDFENVQTAPPEYDFATIDDGLFLFYPQMETPFFKSYQKIRPLPQNFKARLIAVNLFRALRYIKRSVKYNETHYFAHDRQYLEKWLNKK